MSTFNSVSEALDLYVSPFDDEPAAWGDVLCRAGVETGTAMPAAWPGAAGPRHLRWSRRRLLAAAIAAVVIALVATPAFGIGGALLDLIGRTNVPFTQGKTAPYEIKRDFFDLTHFAPPGMAPQAIVAQTRKVGVFDVRGRTRVLYVAPTRKGGYCWMFTDTFGGCRATRTQPRPRGAQPGAINPHLLGLTWQGSRFRVDSQGRPLPGMPQHTTQVGGDILVTNAHVLQVEYEGGSKTPIPFIFVSKPIAAGFFLSAIPTGHVRPGTRVRAVSVLDVNGHVLARQPMSYEYGLPRRLPHPPPANVRPPVRSSPQLPPPVPPLQKGEAEGVTVTAGRNGVAVFDTSNATPDVQTLIGGRTPNYSCFSFMRYHRDAPASNGFSYLTGPRVAIRTFGIRRPFDGCEIQGGYGHRWPDKLDSHSAVEIPFTAAGRRFFADRAAARDLALFLSRNAGIRQMRREPTAVFTGWLRKRFSPRVVELPSSSASPPQGRIGFRTTGSTVLFRRVSSTGHVFTVVVGEKGGIATENVRPLAFVY
jgi:hypothetical protein